MGDARAGLMAVGALLVLASAVPYLLTIASGRTRPRIASWVVWTLLGALATAAAWSEGAYPSAVLTAAATVETGSIVALAWRCGNRDVGRLDAWCLAGVAVGLLLWAVFDSPLVGLTAVLVIDLLAAVPTVRHAWRRPSEEPAVAYALCAVAAVCTVGAVPEYTLVGLLYPVYLLVINTLVAALVLREVRPPAPWSRSARPAARTSPRIHGRHAAPGTPGPGWIPPPASASGRHAAPVTPRAVGLPGPRSAPEARGRVSAGAGT